MTSQELVVKNLTFIQLTCKRLIKGNISLQEDLAQDICLWLLQTPIEKIKMIEENQEGFIYTMIATQIYSNDSKFYRQYIRKHPNHSPSQTSLQHDTIDISNALKTLTELERLTVEAVISKGSVYKAAQLTKIHPTHIKRIHDQAILKLTKYLNQ